MVRPSLRRRKGVRSADLGRSCSAAAPAQCSSRDQASGASGASGATTPLASVAPPLRSVRTGGDLSTSHPDCCSPGRRVTGQRSSLKPQGRSLSHLNAATSAIIDRDERRRAQRPNFPLSPTLIVLFLPFILININVVRPITPSGAHLPFVPLPCHPATQPALPLHADSETPLRIFTCRNWARPATI